MECCVLTGVCDVVVVVAVGAANDFGPEVGRAVVSALERETGLTSLDLGGAWPARGGWDHCVACVASSCVVWGAPYTTDGRVAVWVRRCAANCLGPRGGRAVVSALKRMTRLTSLDLGGPWHGVVGACSVAHCSVMRAD